MSLAQLWKQYQCNNYFTLSSLPLDIRETGIEVSFEPKSIITAAGDYPHYIYFIESGTAQGVRMYPDGNCYSYFSVSEKEGCLGLLELIAQEETYIATTIAKTHITAHRFDTDLIYDCIMKSTDLMRSCLYVISHDLYLRSGNDGLLYYHSGLKRVEFFLTTYYCLHENSKKEVFLEVDYQAIADSIGVSVRTVGRSVNYLKKMGLVTSSKRKVSISYDQYQHMLEDIQIQ